MVDLHSLSKQIHSFKQLWLQHQFRMWHLGLLSQSFTLQDCQDKPVHPPHCSTGTEELQCFSQHAQIILNNEDLQGDKCSRTGWLTPNGSNCSATCRVSLTQLGKPTGSSTGTEQLKGANLRAPNNIMSSGLFSWEQQFSLKASSRYSEGLLCF